MRRGRSKAPSLKYQRSASRRRSGASYRKRILRVLGFAPEGKYASDCYPATTGELARWADEMPHPRRLARRGR